MARIDLRNAYAERSLLLFALAALGGLIVYALIARLMTGSVAGFDPVILRAARAHTGQNGTAIDLARDVTALGNNLTLWVVTLLSAGYLATARRSHALMHLLTITALGGLATSAIKALVDRPRPDVVAQLASVHAASFPSGHAMNSAFVYGTLAIIAARATASTRQAHYVIAAALLLTGSIGASRIVLGVHWPSDVLAGWAIGAGWAGIAAASLFRARASATLAP